jgi:hypothetical protein
LHRNGSTRYSIQGSFYGWDGVGGMVRICCIWCVFETSDVGIIFVCVLGATGCHVQGSV